MTKKINAKPRNYAATEATLINLRALKKKVAAIDEFTKDLDARLTVIETRAVDGTPVVLEPEPSVDDDSPVDV